MKKYKNFVVYGPGRTGSHWVEALLIGLFSTVHYRKDDFCLSPDHWIYHTNKIDHLREIPLKMRDSITLIVCDRANKFDTVLSNIIAIKTNEYCNYTDKIIEPFHVDPEYFKDLSRGHRCYLDEFNCEIVPIYDNIIRIDYDTLSAAAVPEQYIADQLGVDYQVRSDYHLYNFKNPRNYKDLILNWEELHQIHQEWPVDQ